jgi:hypothetical protein
MQIWTAELAVRRNRIDLADCETHGLLLLSHTINPLEDLKMLLDLSSPCNDARTALGLDLVFFAGSCEMPCKLTCRTGDFNSALDFPCLIQIQPRSSRLVALLLETFTDFDVSTDDSDTH